MSLIGQGTRSTGVIVAAIAAALIPGGASAAMALTGLGPHTFTLTTYASGFPTVAGCPGCPFPVGPLGIAYRTDGKVLVADANNSMYLLPSHIDGLTGPTLSATYASVGLRGLAQIPSGGGYRYFVAEQQGNEVIEVDPNGVSLGNVISISAAADIVPYPPAVSNGHTGHLFVSGAAPSGQGAIFEVDPVADTQLMVFQGPLADGKAFVPDGISFTPDGTTLFAVSRTNGETGPGRVIGIDIATGTVVYTTTDFIIGPDGVAVGLGSSLAGFLYVIGNVGDVWEGSMSDSASWFNIATGGTRGDFASADPDHDAAGTTNPTLLLDQTDRILRLDSPNGGWFGGPTSSTLPVAVGAGPLPAWSYLLLGALLIWSVIRRPAFAAPAVSRLRG